MDGRSKWGMKSHNDVKEQATKNDIKEGKEHIEIESDLMQLQASVEDQQNDAITQNQVS